MKERVAAKGFEFPYLFDPGQIITKQYGPQRTPHVFLLEKTSEGNVVRYVGAIDNDTENTNPDKISYVEQAVKAIKSGRQPDPATTKAIGCGVKWQKSCAAISRQEAEVITGFFTDICLMNELTEKLNLNRNRPIVFFYFETTDLKWGEER